MRFGITTPNMKNWSCRGRSYLKSWTAGRLCKLLGTMRLHNFSPKGSCDKARPVGARACELPHAPAAATPAPRDDAPPASRAQHGAIFSTALSSFSSPPPAAPPAE